MTTVAVNSPADSILSLALGGSEPASAKKWRDTHETERDQKAACW